MKLSLQLAPRRTRNSQLSNPTLAIHLLSVGPDDDVFPLLQFGLTLRQLIGGAALRDEEAGTAAAVPVVVVALRADDVACANACATFGSTPPPLIACVAGMNAFARREKYRIEPVESPTIKWGE